MSTDITEAQVQDEVRKLNLSEMKILKINDKDFFHLCFIHVETNVTYFYQVEFDFRYQNLNLPRWVQQMNHIVRDAEYMLAVQIRKSIDCESFPERDFNPDGQN